MKQENGFNKRLQPPWEFESGMFSFSPTEERLANWVTWAQRRKLSSFRGFYLCLAVKSQPRAVTLWASPHEGPYGTAV